MLTRPLVVGMFLFHCLHAQSYKPVQLPLSFEVNQGQADAEVQYLVREGRQTLFLTKSKAVLSLAAPMNLPPGRLHSVHDLRSQQSPGAAIRMSLRNSQPAAFIEARDPLLGKVNYLIGNDSSRWHTDIPTYGRIAYRGVYPGIDLVYYGTQGKLEYDLIASPGANINAIQVQFEGADHVRLNDEGDLILDTAAGPVRWKKPYVYQEDHGVRQPIAANYRLTRDHLVEFALARYDRKRPLIIDPTLVYSTYLDGANIDGAFNMFVDSTGIYATGATYATNFPTTVGALQRNLSGFVAAFAAKLNPQGTALLYSTYIGGSEGTLLNGSLLSSDGSLYLVGPTDSENFPVTASAYQRFYNFDSTEMAYVTHLSSTFNGLVFSTYLGGSVNDNIQNVAKDPSGNVYVAGITSSSDFPVTQGAVETRYSGFDNEGFVTKFNSTGSALIYSTFLGGSGDESAQFSNYPTAPRVNEAYGIDLAVDPSGFAYVGGVTTSCDFPTTAGAYQRTNSCNGGTGYAVKLNANGTGFAYSTLLGGSVFDAVISIRVDTTGSVLLTGVTASSNFPTTTGAFSRTFAGGATDGFAARLDPTGSTLTYSTLFGGSDQEAIVAGDLASNGYVVLSGLTYSSNLPTTTGTYQPTYGGAGDCFLTVLDPTLSHLVDSTYLGTSLLDSGTAFFGTGPTDLLVAINTFSTAFPTTSGAIQRTGVAPSGDGNAVFARFSLPAVTAPALSITKTHSGNFTQGQQGAAYTVTVSNGSGAGPTSGTVTVTENVPSGLTLVSMTGGGWTCGPNGGLALGTCNRNDSLTPGGTYPLTVTVNVAASASSPQVNSVSVSGGGSATAGTNDSTVITANSCTGITLSAAGATLFPTGTSTVETCPNNSGQPNCGVLPESPASFTVTPGAGCGAWTATSSNPEFLQITSGASRTGVGTVQYVLLNNTHNGQQNYTITVASGGASQTYAITQTGSGNNEIYRQVYALYEQLLGRDPDAPGFGFWTGTGGAGLGQMADSFLTSPESFNSNFAVLAAYQAATNQPPSFAQFKLAVAALRAGTQPLETLLTSLLPGGYSANTMYQYLLNRAPTAGEISAYATNGPVASFESIIGYPAGTTPVGAPNNEFQSTGSFHTDHTNSLYMTMLYYTILSRDPDQAGFNFWLGVANDGGAGLLFQGATGYPTRIQILGPGTPNQGYIGSPEFQSLFAN